MRHESEPERMAEDNPCLDGSEGGLSTASGSAKGGAPRPGFEPGTPSLEARRDIRFTIGAKAEGEGVEPTSP
jgi:hypothetical protein